MMKQNTKTELQKAQKNVEDITPDQVDRTNKEYKLAFYWFWMFKNEKHEHSITKQELEAQEGAVEEYANAYHSQDRKGLTSVKIAQQKVNGILAACTEIDNIAKPSKFGELFKITWPFVALFLGGVFLWQMATNQAFREAILNPVLLVIVACVVFVFYLWRQKS